MDDVIVNFNRIRLKYKWPYTELKEEQQQAINFILNKNNVFAFLPTGYGKSEIYVLPPLLLDEVNDFKF